MKAKICSLLLVLLVISTGHAQQRSNYGESPWGPIDFMWTNLSAEKCNHVTRFQNNDFRRCPPVAGYQLLFRGNEASPQLIVITPNRKRHVIHYWDLKADNFISLDKQVSWKLARSRTGKIIPLSLMLEVNIQHDEFTRFRGPSTVVVKLTPKEVCVVARIPVDPSSPGYVASISTSARGLKCVGIDNVGEKDWFGVVVGLVEKGQHEEAKSTIKQIQSPATRTVAYVHIARAQAESGDQAAARTTLLQGLDEVLNQKQVTIFFNAYGMRAREESKDGNLISILSTMAEVGLYDDVNDKLKFVSNSELPRALLWIGKAQGISRSEGGRGDREAANITFNRAVQLELARADTTAADSNLLEIVRGQAEVGLINQAKKTVLLIKSPEVRRAAESVIASHVERLR